MKLKITRMEKGYLIYLTRQKKKDSKTLTKECKLESEKYLDKVTTIVINAYDGIPKKDWNRWERKWEKYSKFRMKKG